MASIQVIYAILLRILPMERRTYDQYPPHIWLPNIFLQPIIAITERSLDPDQPEVCSSNTARKNKLKWRKNIRRTRKTEHCLTEIGSTNSNTECNSPCLLPWCRTKSQADENAASRNYISFEAVKRHTRTHDMESFTFSSSLYNRLHDDVKQRGLCEGIKVTLISLLLHVYFNCNCIIYACVIGPSLFSIWSVL